MNMAQTLALLVCYEYSSGSRVLFFHNMAPASVRFYALISSIVMVHLKLKMKNSLASTQN